MSVFFITVLVTLLASNQAFLAPNTRRISSRYSSLSTVSQFTHCCPMCSVVMKLGENAQGLIGSDLEWPEFDPLGFTKDASPEKVAWYVVT